MQRIPTIPMGILMVTLVICCCGLMSVAEGKTYAKYRDPKQPLNARIKDLMRRMSLEEKIGQMVQIERSVASAVVMKKYFIGKIRSFTVGSTTVILSICQKYKTANQKCQDSQIFFFLGV